MKYLTASYVEWLGLELVPLRRPRNTAIVCISNENAIIPHPENVGFDVGVVIDGATYKRADDGLSFDLTYTPHE